MKIVRNIVIAVSLAPLLAFAQAPADSLTQTPPPIQNQPLPENISALDRTPPAPNKFNGRNFEILSRRGELMIKESDLKKIYDALNGIIIKKPEINSVAAAVNEPPVAPYFFLKSVLYFSPANWSVWVNNRKFTPFYNKNYATNADTAFEIATVDYDSVRLIWHPHNLDAMSPGWRQKLSPITPAANSKIKEPGFISRSGKIFVSQDGSYVEITLAPNQTFIALDMDVAEGNVNPQPLLKKPTVDKTTDKTKDSITPQAPVTPDTNVTPNSPTQPGIKKDDHNEPAPADNKQPL